MPDCNWITKEGTRIVSVPTKLQEKITVYMHAPDGRIWKEDDYAGASFFGGKDYYELLAELNGIEEEDMHNAGVEFAVSGNKDIVWPILSESKTWTGKFTVPNEQDSDEITRPHKKRKAVPDDDVEIARKLGVTRDQFMAYRRVQHGGRYNMLDWRAEAATGLPHSVYMLILEKYGKIMKAYKIKN